MEFRYNPLIPIYWVIFTAIKACCYFCVFGGGKLSCSHFSNPATVPFLLLKAKSYLYALSTSHSSHSLSDIFQAGLPHTSPSTLLLSATSDLHVTKSDCQFSFFTFLVLSAALDIADHSLFLEMLPSFSHTLVFCLPHCHF